MTVCIDLVVADHGSGVDKDVVMDDHTTTGNGCWIDKGAVIDNRGIYAWFFWDHQAGNPVFIANLNRIK